MSIHPMPEPQLRQAVIAEKRNQEDVFPDRVLVRFAAAAATGALLLTLAVHLDATGGIDRFLFELVHAGERWTPTTSPVWWNEAVRDITALGGFAVLAGAVLASCAYLLAAGRFRLLALLLGSAVAATLFSTLVKFSIARVRPQSVEHLVATASASFPSGHALLSAAIILTMGGLVAFQARKPAERRVIVAAAFMMTFCVGLSRIWLGVHWPMDVLAGWMFGTAWAAMTLWLAKRVDRQGQKPAGLTQSP
jgi:undecaprenyl-diphosphatase